MFQRRRGWAWAALLLSIALPLAVSACRGTAVAPSTQGPGSGVPGPRVVTPREETYLQLAGQVISQLDQLTRLLGGVAIELSRMPEDAARTQEVVSAIKNSLEHGRERVGSADPPAGYEKLHQGLLKALELYIAAAGTLLPADQTGKADALRFQELMPQGGKHAHEAISAFEELRRPQ